MIQVYKVPIEQVSIEDLKSLVGTMGSVLNPIQDIDNNWILSKQEWEAQEFQYIKAEYPDLASLFFLIDWHPKPTPPPIS